MANITLKYALNAKGILSIEENVVSLEVPDTGEVINLSELLEDFADKTVKLSINYDEDYE